MKIGVIIADKDEFRIFEDFFSKNESEPYSFMGRRGEKVNIEINGRFTEVLFLLCGIGKVNAATAAMHLADNGYDIILNCGLSGGIKGVSRGEICLPDRFLEHDFDLSALGYGPCEKPGQEYIYNADTRLMEIFLQKFPEAKVGTAVSGDHFICSQSKNREMLKTEFSAMCCDMESAAIAYVCAFSNLPFMSFRRISDDAGEDAVATYTEMNTSDETALADIMISFIEEYLKNCD